MAYKVNSLEEMPNALFYLIESVEVLQSKVNALQHKQASSSPKWMDIDELCAYLPSHPAKQTVYGWVSTKQIPVHKINKALAFLQSEIDDWLKNKSHIYGMALHRLCLEGHPLPAAPQAGGRGAGCAQHHRLPPAGGLQHRRVGDVPADGRQPAGGVDAEK